MVVAGVLDQEVKAPYSEVKTTRSSNKDIDGMLLFPK
jgi:hypothetical protein